MPIAVAGHERSGFCFGGGGVVRMLLCEGRNRQHKNEGEQGQEAAMHGEPPQTVKWDELFADCSILEMAACKRLPLGNLSPLHPCFAEVVDFKDKVFCFDTLLEAFIVKGLRLHQNCAISSPLCRRAGILNPASPLTIRLNCYQYLQYSRNSQAL
jgi:hypothetical protein